MLFIPLTVLKRVTDKCVYRIPLEEGRRRNQLSSDMKMRSRSERWDHEHCQSQYETYKDAVRFAAYEVHLMLGWARR
jgi:hypothetical protein